MADRDQHEEIPSDETPTEKGSDAQSTAGFQSASEFLDNEIDSVEDISELSIEALVVLSILRIVNHSKELRVNIIRASRLVIIELDVKEEDLGQVIGKDGHTVDAVRSIARSASGDSGVEYDIMLLEKGRRPQRGRRRRSPGRNDRPRGRYHRQRSGY
jgi:predicted RNA-binding protein YlqC (UPF0109 family)